MQRTEYHPDRGQPPGPDIPLRQGERVELDCGTLFFEKQWSETEDCVWAGVKPADGRKYDWLDPRGLYRLHYQTVELHFDLYGDQGVS